MLPQLLSLCAQWTAANAEVLSSTMLLLRLRARDSRQCQGTVVCITAATLIVDPARDGYQSQGAVVRPTTTAIIVTCKGQAEGMLSTPPPQLSLMRPRGTAIDAAPLSAPAPPPLRSHTRDGR